MPTKIKFLRFDANSIKARFIKGEDSDIIKWLTSPQTKNRFSLHFFIHKDDAEAFTKDADVQKNEQALGEFNSLCQKNFFEITDEQTKNTHISNTMPYGLPRPILVSSNISSNRPHINPVTMGQDDVIKLLKNQ
ncbi:hypothetical protein [Iodobacter ciconiae]|uniref:Uncharacterized protein n=1 Tax=Iodobacter ciconiae TaxID=2496266 RepID=A0A3S8ZRZ0_9NEIS|nr:hypothetical protein [Iodobacter ciconiae]AZN36280.1 hypothetical protein EJO50_07140 [Iodobacter ciconiae]